MEIDRRRAVLLAKDDERGAFGQPVVSDEYRAWLRSVFTDLVEAAGAKDSKQLGRELALLYDGAAVAARMDQDRRGAAIAMRSAVEALLDAAIPPKRSNRRAP